MILTHLVMFSFFNAAGPTNAVAGVNQGWRLVVLDF